MKSNSLPAFHTGRFIDLTPLPADVVARREEYRFFVVLSCLLIVACALTSAGKVYVDDVVGSWDASPLGLFFRIFL